MMPATQIKDGNHIICPRCDVPHALFYVRSTDKKRGLFYMCNKYPRKAVSKYGYKEQRLVKAKCPVELVDGLEIEERWTKAYAKLMESRQHIGVVA